MRQATWTVKSHPLSRQEYDQPAPLHSHKEHGKCFLPLEGPDCNSWKRRFNTKGEERHSSRKTGKGREGSKREGRGETEHDLEEEGKGENIQRKRKKREVEIERTSTRVCWCCLSFNRGGNGGLNSSFEASCNAQLRQRSNPH